MGMAAVMGRITFENYARRAEAGLSSTVIAGRYNTQVDAEKRIVPDVAAKLALGPEDTLLEIGCGVGNLLIPLSFLAGEAAGIDHPKVLDTMSSRVGGSQLNLIEGNFLDLDLDQIFSKILIYSVLHCLANAEEAIRFVHKALDHLEPGGSLLVGDIPNTDRKRRFQQSETGKAFEMEWAKRSGQESGTKVDLEDDPDVFSPDDAFVLELLRQVRKRGYNAYALPQPLDLPFGHTREDILADSLT